MMNLKSAKAIVTDIEGTITDINFVKDILFPYSLEKIEEFIMRNWKNIRSIRKEVESMVGRELDKKEFTNIMKIWIKKDNKIPPLKELQGLIWEEGYKNGELKGHIYEDALERLKKIREMGIPIYIYSSGSVKAQKLLFSHTEYGDITYLFSGYFDTRIGGKKERKSYLKIAECIGTKPYEIMFFSDNTDELRASKDAGIVAVKVVREGHCDEEFPCIKSFYEIEV